MVSKTSMPVKYQDSIGKVISYISSVNKYVFTYNGKAYNTPKSIRISPLFFRDYLCPEDCGACCPKFSLDYWDTKRNNPQATDREITVNGITKTIRTDFQIENTDTHCKNVNKTIARCKIHGHQPFSCDFELRKFINRQGNIILIKKFFGRGWQLTKCNRQKGALCVMCSGDYKEFLLKDIALLEELNDFAKMFNIETYIPEIIKYLQTVLSSGILPKNAVIIK